nr:MAG TPA: Lysis protein [Bacteriophage sp.]
MKKLTSLALIIALGIVACSPVKQNRYQDGTYVTVNSGCGYIITDDGNVWGYFDRTIPSGSSVLVTISDEGTEKVEDDVITNVVEK